MSEDEFNKPVKMKLKVGTMVAGKPEKKGATVTVAGNDKVQLLASKRAELVPEEEKKEKAS